VTWNRRVQGLESSGKDRQTGECTYGQEPYGYTTPSSFEEPDTVYLSRMKMSKRTLWTVMKKRKEIE
jgi:hypothetical protein